MKKLTQYFLVLLLVFAVGSLACAEDKPKLEPSKDTAKEEKKADEDVDKKDYVGKVTKLTGTAKYTRAGKEAAVTKDMKIFVLDKIEVAAKSVVVVTLFNTPGNEYDIKNATKLTYGENTTATIQKRKKEVNGDSTTKIEVEKGKVGSDVKDGRKPKWKERRERQRSGRKATRGKSNYEVTTPTAIAGVRGTEFIVAVTPKKTFVYVKSGEVWVKDRVKGDIRALKRKRLLEIGINGFGVEIKTEDVEREAMENTEFTPTFDPIPTKKRIDRATSDSVADKASPEDAVKKDVEEQMDKTKGTADNSETPDAVEPGSIAPEVEPTPGGGDLPDPPEPPQ